MEASKSKEFVHIEYIQASTDVDDDRCWITGLAVLNYNQLILADSKNFSIKLVDLSSNQVVDQIKTDHYPLDVAVADKTKCAATFPVDRAIRFINVTTETITLSDEELHVDGDCRCLCFYGNRILITFSCPAKFQILEKDGTILRTVMLDSEGYLIFNEPYYVTANNKHIMVSDHGEREITRLNWDGHVLDRFKSDGCPHGVTATDNSFLFVCGENIYQCNNRNEIGVVVRDLKFPYTIVYSETNNFLFVSSHKGYDKNDNYVQVLEKIEDDRLI